MNPKFLICSIEKMKLPKTTFFGRIQACRSTTNFLSLNIIWYTLYGLSLSSSIDNYGILFLAHNNTSSLKVGKSSIYWQNQILAFNNPSDFTSTPYYNFHLSERRRYQLQVPDSAKSMILIKKMILNWNLSISKTASIP